MGGLLMMEKWGMMSAVCLRGVFSASGALSKNPSSPGFTTATVLARSKRERDGGRTGLNRKDREALAVSWRRASVEVRI
jgi:hypothetical protein